MQVPYRQGIVQCPKDFTNTPNFLQLISGTVYISTQTSPLFVTFSQGPSEYLMQEEANSLIAAFPGPFISTLSYWFYWDLNVITGLKTYGYTNLEPFYGPVQPSNPAIGQHWFSTSEFKQFYWNGTIWVNVIRVFAGKLQNTQVTNTYALVAVNTVLKIFSVATDITPEFITGQSITITDSGGNDGTYTVTGYNFNVTSGNTDISVLQPILFSSPNGYLHHTPAGITNAGLVISFNTNSQANINTPILSGFIFYDQSGHAVKLLNGQFFTTESAFIVAVGVAQPRKLEESFIFGAVTVNMAAFQVISVSDTDSTIFNPAAYTDIDEKILGIIDADTGTGQTTIAFLQGIVQNPLWDWGVPNLPLWVDNGSLTPTDPSVLNPSLPPKPPIARTLSPTTILFTQALAGLGSPGPAGPPGTAVNASATVKGVTKLSINPIVATNPIAVGDNDVRNTNARTPLPHTQAASTIDVALYEFMIGPDGQSALQQLVDAIDTKVNRSGDTMTGDLGMGNLFRIINLPLPLVGSDAANKTYVDNIDVSVLITTSTNGELTPILRCAPVYVSSTDNVKLAKANALATTKVVGLVADATILPSPLTPGRIVGNGFFSASIGEWNAVTGQGSGLTPGATYYLSETTVGKLTVTPPVTPGNFLAVIGIAMSATKMKLTFNPVVQI